jgi:hypothetical protein
MKLKIPLEVCTGPQGMHIKAILPTLDGTFHQPEFCSK